jgi:hypothetical protein
MPIAAIALLAGAGAVAHAADAATVSSTVDVAPKAILFAPEEVGNPKSDSKPVVVTFTNSSIAGAPSIKFAGPVISTGFAVVSSGCADRLKPGASCTIAVAFVPVAEGGQRGTLQLVSNAANSPHIVRLRGRGIAAPLEFQKKLNFGQLKLGAAAPALNLTLTNNSPTPIKFSTVAASPPFNVTANTCDTLAPKGGNCMVRVEFAPQTAGTFKGILEMHDTAARNPQHVKLVGVAD